MKKKKTVIAEEKIFCFNPRRVRKHARRVGSNPEFRRLWDRA